MNEKIDKNMKYMDCWKYFKRGSDKNIVICIYCNKELSCKGSQTTGLHRHLEAKHKMTRGSTEDNTISPKRTKLSTTATTLEKYLKCVKMETLEEVIAKLAVVDNMPILTITKSEFIRNSLKLQGFKQLPQHPTDVMNLIKKFSSFVKLEMINQICEMKNEMKKVSLSVDEWTSFRNRRYLNVQIYPENGNSINLGLIRIHGSCPAEKIVELVTNKLEEFSLDLEKDVVGMTSDGASVMVKFGRLSPGYLQLCYNHGIHLAVVNIIYEKKSKTCNENVIEICEDFSNSDDDFEVYSDDELEFDSEYNFNTSSDNICKIITNIRDIVKLFKNSPMKNSILQNYVKETEKQELSLLLDCRTRWNSMLVMIERFLRLADSVEKALHDLNCSYLWSSELKFEANQIFKTLKPVQIAVEALSREDSNLFKAEAILHFLFETLYENKTNFSTKLLTEIKHQISKRRDISLISVIKFLNDPITKYKNNTDNDENSAFFKLCSKSEIIKSAESILQRLGAFDEDTVTADKVDAIVVLSNEETQ